MKSIQVFLLSFVLLFSAVVIQAQNIDDVVNKHLQAIGGKDKISKMTSLYLEGSLLVMGAENPFNTTILNGKGFKSEAEFNGAKIIQVYTDKGGWAINPMGGSSAPEAMPEEQYNTGKSQIFIGAPFYDYASRNIQLTLDGQEDGAIKVKAVNGSVETLYYLDPSTYYIKKSISKAQMMGQEMEITVSYSDYKKTDYGFVLPYSMESDFGGQFQMTSNVKKVEVNKQVDPAIFEMPK